MLMKRLLEKHHIVKSIATRNVLFVCLSLSQTTPHDIKPKTSLLVRFLQQSDWQKLLCTPRKAVAPLPPPTPVVGLASVSRCVVVTSHERCDGRQTGRMVVDWMYYGFYLWKTNWKSWIKLRLRFWLLQPLFYFPKCMTVYAFPFKTLHLDGIDKVFIHSLFSYCYCCLLIAAWNEMNTNLCASIELICRYIHTCILHRIYVNVNYLVNSTVICDVTHSHPGLYNSWK